MSAVGGVAGDPCLRVASSRGADRIPPFERTEVTVDLAEWTPRAAAGAVGVHSATCDDGDRRPSSDRTTERRWGGRGGAGAGRGGRGFGGRAVRGDRAARRRLPRDRVRAGPSRAARSRRRDRAPPGPGVVPGAPRDRRARGRGGTQCTAHRPRPRRRRRGHGRDPAVDDLLRRPRRCTALRPRRRPLPHRNPDHRRLRRRPNARGPGRRPGDGRPGRRCRRRRLDAAESSRARRRTGLRRLRRMARVVRRGGPPPARRRHPGRRVRVLHRPGARPVPDPESSPTWSPARAARSSRAGGP